MYRKRDEENRVDSSSSLVVEKKEQVSEKVEPSRPKLDAERKERDSQLADKKGVGGKVKEEEHEDEGGLSSDGQARSSVGSVGIIGGSEEEEEGQQQQQEDENSKFVYRDFSTVPVPYGFHQSLVDSPLRVQKLPPKLDAMLSNPELTHIISWRPHGRAWKINNSSLFTAEVLPRFFECSFNSFIRLVNAWGFRRILKGPDRSSYFHELFLRDMPHLHTRMHRLTPKEKKIPLEAGDEPDFYQMPQVHPIPSDSVSNVQASSRGSLCDTHQRHTMTSVSQQQQQDLTAHALLGPLNNQAQLLQAQSAIPQLARANSGSLTGGTYGGEMPHLSGLPASLSLIAQASRIAGSLRSNLDQQINSFAVGSLSHLPTSSAAALRQHLSSFSQSSELLAARQRIEQLQQTELQLVAMAGGQHQQIAGLSPSTNVGAGSNQTLDALVRLRALQELRRQATSTLAPSASQNYPRSTMAPRNNQDDKQEKSNFR